MLEIQRQRLTTIKQEAEMLLTQLERAVYGDKIDTKVCDQLLGRGIINSIDTLIYDSDSLVKYPFDYENPMAYEELRDFYILHNGTEDNQCGEPSANEVLSEEGITK